MLHGILGDLTVSSGDMKLRGKLSYASQDPWIFDGTIRQNILFGRTFYQKRYDKVIKLCCKAGILKHHCPTLQEQVSNCVIQQDSLDLLLD